MMLSLLSCPVCHIGVGNDPVFDFGVSFFSFSAAIISFNGCLLDRIFYPVCFLSTRHSGRALPLPCLVGSARVSSF